MDPTVWVIIGIVVIVAAIAVLLWWRSQQMKTAQLKERFGPEYDRAVDEHEDRKEAERKLAAVDERRRSLRIIPLRDESRARYHQQWSEVQARFVDQPGQAVRQGDQLITAVMRERGYPMDDFDSQAAMIAIDHPDVVEKYREAHLISGRADDDATTEELRRAFVRYRELFTALVGQRPEGEAVDRASDNGSMPEKRHSPGT
jgi:FtsZ-interacting cell division protein ZipA